MELQTWGLWYDTSKHINLESSDADYTRMLIVARSEHGRQFVRNRCPGNASLRIGLRRHYFDHLIHQYHGHTASMLLLNFRPGIWLAANGLVEVLLWILWC